MHVHFFKASSRLGLPNVPNKGSEKNIGVEHGPEGILTPEFLRQLQSNYSLSHFHFPTPDEVNPKTYYEVLAQSQKDFIAHICAQTRNDQVQVVIGGDHSVSFGSVVAILNTLPKQSTIGFVQFDSHADLHMISTSPSGNFHGMWVRALTSGIGNKSVDTQVTRHLDPHAITYYGNLDLEAEEVKYIRENHIDVWSGDDLSRDPTHALAHLRAFITQYDHIHVSFDIDVFERTLAPATGTPAPNGLSEEHVFPLLEALSHARHMSIDLVEVNPEKPGAQKTIALGQRVIETLLRV
jgi:arginase